ncbi:MAG: PD-(D/E)XK nuclease family protein, partial [Deltaproteobacteria bacterium]|jgi:hypothetical protein|nr:PD-(D/E)XK nuclease family protein [Deltaproteobacteria bacterium]
LENFFRPFKGRPVKVPSGWTDLQIVIEQQKEYSRSRPAGRRPLFERSLAHLESCFRSWHRRQDFKGIRILEIPWHFGPDLSSEGKGSPGQFRAAEFGSGEELFFVKGSIDRLEEEAGGENLIVRKFRFRDSNKYLNLKITSDTALENQQPEVLHLLLAKRAAEDNLARPARAVLQFIDSREGPETAGIKIEDESLFQNFIEGLMAGLRSGEDREPGSCDKCRYVSICPESMAPELFEPAQGPEDPAPGAQAAGDPAPPAPSPDKPAPDPAEVPW